MAKSPSGKSTSGKALGKTLVIVESPTKAKTIRKFLKGDYIVESCMGHIRDLPRSAKDIPKELKKESWASLGVNVEKEFAPIYCIPKDKIKIVNELKSLVKDASSLLLATDEDREGESISWHLLQVLKPKVPVKRMVFHEITKEAIEKSLKQTRTIDENLVHAQEARRILDRLVGYTLSPLLWKKVAYGLSAGRVQSVAVRMICERERDRMRFKRSEYWGVFGQLEKDKVEFESRLLSYDGKRLATGKDFDGLTGQIPDKKKSEFLHLMGDQAKKLATEVKAKPWKVLEIEEKPVSRRPAAPFITSTLQQEASRKLGLGAREAMRVAQSLYEQGLITYMRTDSTVLSQQAITAAQKAIKSHYGESYLPAEPRIYTGKKVKGAQEAHEAIRPAGTDFPMPEETGLKGDQLRLYELIWKRTLASQMEDAKQKQVSVRIGAGPAIFAASGLSIVFPGFLRVYVEGQDDPDAALEEREVILPPMKVGDTLKCLKLEPTQHETKPPARFTEASLIQTMEKEGIGRPSTYAPTISTIVDRGYVVKMAGNALSPTFTALVVNKLLSQYFPQYVDVGFTSQMEKSLDDIAEGELDSIRYLKGLYMGKDGLRSQVALQEKKIDPDEARGMELDSLKGLQVRVGRYGAYVCRPDKEAGEVCASLPESQAPAEITLELANQLIDQKLHGTDALGKDPKSGLPIYVLNGRYGPYVQLGDAAGKEVKPKRASLPPNVKMEDVKIEMAIELLNLPRLLGNHPDTKKEIKAGLGRFGPYLLHEGEFRSIPKTDNLFTIDLTRALEIFAEPKRGRGRSSPLKILGKHPSDQVEVAVYTGKYGPYVKWGKLNASVPESQKAEDLTMEQAVELLNQKQGKEPSTKKPPKAAKSSKTDKIIKKPASPKAALEDTSKVGAAKKTIKSKVPPAAASKTGKKVSGASKSK